MVQLCCCAICFFCQVLVFGEGKRPLDKPIQRAEFLTDGEIWGQVECAPVFCLFCGGQVSKIYMPPNSVDLRGISGKKADLLSFLCGGTFFPKLCIL